MPTVVNNKKYETAIIHFVANGTVIVAGNSSVSNVASGDEVVTSGTIRRIWYGSPSGNAAHWTISRGGNLAFVVDGTGRIDFDDGAVMTTDSAANVVATLVGATTGFLMVELKKTVNNYSTVY